MCMCVLLECVSMHNMCSRCSQRSEEGARTLGIEVKNSHKTPCGHWESIPSFLEEQRVLLAAEPLQQNYFNVLSEL